jgi:hydrogenase expression/formation protein HypC
MCIAVPSKIIKIKDNIATIDVDGAQREVSLLLLEDPKVGEYVVVHAGFAINKINEEHALESLKLIREAVSVIFGDPKKETDSG